MAKTFAKVGIVVVLFAGCVLALFGCSKTDNLEFTNLNDTWSYNVSDGVTTIKKSTNNYSFRIKGIPDNSYKYSPGYMKIAKDGAVDFNTKDDYEFNIYDADTYRDSEGRNVEQSIERDINTGHYYYIKNTSDLKIWKVNDEDEESMGVTIVFIYLPEQSIYILTSGLDVGMANELVSLFEF